MSDILDEKLAEIIVNECKIDPNWGDPVIESNPTAIEQIKVAFMDAGYVKIPNVTRTQEGTIEVSTDRGVRYNGVPLMTGQAWFDAWMNEIPDDLDAGGIDNELYEAARRAAGLSKGE